MIATIIASVLLFITVALMLNIHERHFERLRRDLIIDRRAFYDLQRDISALDSNIHLLRHEIMKLRIAIISMEMPKDVNTSSDEHNQDKGTK